jgi:hypothetical protein
LVVSDVELQGYIGTGDIRAIITNTLPRVVTNGSKGKLRGATILQDVLQRACVCVCVCVLRTCVCRAGVAQKGGSESVGK